MALGWPSPEISGREYRGREPMQAEEIGRPWPATDPRLQDNRKTTDGRPGYGRYGHAGHRLVSDSRLNLRRLHTQGQTLARRLDRADHSIKSDHFPLIVL